MASGTKLARWMGGWVDESCHESSYENGFEKGGYLLEGWAGMKIREWEEKEEEEEVNFEDSGGGGGLLDPDRNEALNWLRLQSH